jgi:hypothetical protein
MPYSAYQLYQAERVKNDAERRQADTSLGRMAAAVSHFRRSVIRPVARQLDQRPAQPGHHPKVGHLG